MNNEAHARIKINKLLEEADWRFFDNEQGKANILLENHVKITQKEVDAWGNDFEKTKSRMRCQLYILVFYENKNWIASSPSMSNFFIKVGISV